MKRSDKKMLLMLLLMLGVAGTPLASAEGVRRAPAANSGGSGQDVAVQRLLRQLTTEKEEAVAKNLENEKRIQKLEAELAKAQKKAGNTEETVGKYKEVYSEASNRIMSMQDKMKALVSKFRETIVVLKETEKEKNRIAEELAGKDAIIVQHAKNNARLYAINMELLDKYKNKGVMDALMQNEPITQLKRVEIETIGEQYRNEMDDLVAGTETKP